MQKQETLSKNQKIILDLIEKSDQPLKAYSILFDVKKKGINAPLQVIITSTNEDEILFYVYYGSFRNVMI